MKIAPTLDGGLRIDADSLVDWMMLELICADASRIPVPLYKQISSRMKPDEDWLEFVVPDIVHSFNEQITFVSRAISAAPKDEEHAGSIFILKEDAMTWYGAVNQARISLENLHNLSKLEEIETEAELDKLDDEIRSALMRNHFYTTVQSLLLEYVV